MTAADFFVISMTAMENMPRPSGAGRLRAVKHNTCQRPLYYRYQTFKFRYVMVRKWPRSDPHAFYSPMPALLPIAVVQFQINEVPQMAHNRLLILKIAYLKADVHQQIFNASPGQPIRQSKVSPKPCHPRHTHSP